MTPFDPASNKSILILTSTGIASLSYCGLAYLEGETTDTWIVEQVRGAKIPRHPDGRHITSYFGQADTFPTLQEALGRIRAGLQRIREGPAASDLRRAPVIVVGVGWQFYRMKRPRPIFFGVAPGHLAYETVWGPRVYGSTFLSQAVPDGHLSPKEVGELAERLAPLSLDDAETEMGRTTRMVAARTRGVGSDCMAVAISPPVVGNCHVRIRFIPKTHSVAMLEAGGLVAPAAVSFGPWLLSPGMWMAPTIMSAGGTTECQLGAYKVKMEGPTADGRLEHPGLVMFMQSQVRRPQP